jgi:hypothetical protein
VGSACTAALRAGPDWAQTWRNKIIFRGGLPCRFTSTAADF